VVFELTLTSLQVAESGCPAAYAVSATPESVNRMTLSKGLSGRLAHGLIPVHAEADVDDDD
jgi:hypothetical protein